MLFNIFESISVKLCLIAENVYERRPLQAVPLHLTGDFFEDILCIFINAYSRLSADKIAYSYMYECLHIALCIHTLYIQKHMCTSVYTQLYIYMHYKYRNVYLLYTSPL